MWHQQVIYALEQDNFSEELLQDITNHIGSVTTADFKVGYEIIVTQMIELAYTFIDNNQIPSCSLIIDYLRFWNEDIYLLQSLWALTNLEIAYCIKCGKVTKAKNMCMALMDEQSIYSVGCSALQLYEYALTLYQYISIVDNCKQQATQAIVILQQLIIQSNNDKLYRKIHLLMAKVYSRLGQLEKSVYESNQFNIQALKVAQQVLADNDQLLLHYKQMIKPEQMTLKPSPLPLHQMQQNQNIKLEQREIYLDDQLGMLMIYYNHKSNELTLEFLGASHIFNLSDIINDITIHELNPLAIFLNEFVEAITSHLHIKCKILQLSINQVNLESYQNSTLIQMKKQGHSFVYFTDEFIDLNSALSPLVYQDQDVSVRPLIYDQN